MTGTGVFMVATLLSLAVSWRYERRVPVMPLVSAAFVFVFGGLTIYLNNDIFIKLKPTLVNILFASVLFTAHYLRRNVLKHLLGSVLTMDDDGWRTLGLRWAFFLLALAVANEVVWRTMTTDAWVNFKVFAIMPLTLVFSALQTPLILRHQVATENEG